MGFFACTNSALSTVEKFPTKTCSVVMHERLKGHEAAGHVPVDVIQFPDGSFILVFAAPKELTMYALFYLPPGAPAPEELKVWRHIDSCLAKGGQTGNFYEFSQKLQEAKNPT